ncbi:Pol protein [Tieghemostelium lacteum]|uniref:Pol protein n=1 Tax=Tieghemostelium lacteum TaxID=361077 RepID=A0A151ZRZ4_TIELA|nr:Pol protein [Tieghemostelium lacteum]|eukprot:KYQ96716.1 Pol protein [Tieghemostelium lacteum]
MIRTPNHLNLQGIFPRIARIVHHKGRNTFFRFFARCLPGINHQRKRCPLNECSLTFSDPYIHFFFNCKLSIKHCNEIVPIVNQLSIKKIHSWSLNAIDLNQISHHEKTFPTLMAIIMNQMWNIICYNLFETDKSNKPPPVMNIAIIRKELSETINIAKWKLLKYLDYQSRINNSNDDVKLKFEFNRNWQTKLQTRTKTRRPHKKKTKTRRRTPTYHNINVSITTHNQNSHHKNKTIKTKINTI